MNTDLFGDPRGAAHVVSLFLRAEEVDSDEDDLRTFSVRMGMQRSLYLDAMASKAGVSRNRMTNELIRIGMDAVVSALPTSARGEVEEEWIRIGQEYQAANGHPEVR